jgi:hypothetical protein
MKPLDRPAELVFRKLAEGLDTVGDCRKIDGSINVEVIDLTKLGPLVSISRLHNSSDNAPARNIGVVFLISSIGAITGNLVQDADEYVYPISYQHNDLTWEAIEVKDGRWNVYPDLQADICRFANHLLLQIFKQQNL